MIEGVYKSFKIKEDDENIPASIKQLSEVTTPYFSMFDIIKQEFFTLLGFMFRKRKETIFEKALLRI